MPASSPGPGVSTSLGGLTLLIWRTGGRLVLWFLHSPAKEKRQPEGQTQSEEHRDPGPAWDADLVEPEDPRDPPPAWGADLGEPGGHPHPSLGHDLVEPEDLAPLAEPAPEPALAEEIIIPRPKPAPRPEARSRPKPAPTPLHPEAKDGGAGQMPLPLPDGTIEPPPLALLDEARRSGKGFTKEQLDELSRQVEMKLADFGVVVEVVAVHPGPVVTLFEMNPAPGTKASKITGLSRDIARALSTLSVRVVEVIPGKSVIGLEIPNRVRETVVLR